METLQNFVLNENLPTYDYGEYLKCLKKEIIGDIEEKALKAGFDPSLVEELQKILNEKLDIKIVEGIDQGYITNFEEDILKWLEQGLIEGIKQWLEEGPIAGIKKRIEQGREEGIKQGREEGIEQGREKGQQEIITKMLKSGLSEKEVNKILNISLDES